MLPLDSPRLLTIDAEFVEFVAYPTDDVGGAVVKLRIRATEEEARRLDLPAEREALFAGARQVWSIEVITYERAELVRGPAIEEDIDNRGALERALARLDGSPRPDPSAPRPAQRLPGDADMNPHQLKRNLRSFVELDLALPDGRVAIVSENGAGKSTLATWIDWALFGPDSHSFASYLTQGSAETEMLLELTFEEHAIAGVPRTPAAPSTKAARARPRWICTSSTRPSSRCTR